jgi:chromosome segregation ATPase
MSKVYQSVRGVVQGTLHRPKPQIMVSAATKGNEGNLKDAIEQLEKIFVDGVGRLKAAASDDQAVVAIAAQHAEQLIEGLKANITVLEARLRETEDTLDKKDVASQNMEERLRTEIGDLQSTLKKKEEDLENRVSEVNDLKSKTDVLVEQVTQSELALQQAKRDAAIAAQHAEQLIEGLKSNITVLEARVRQTEDAIHKQDVASQQMEESFGTEIRDLQSALKKKEEDLETRESEVNDLNSKINVLQEQVSHLKLVIEQAQGHAASESQHAEQAMQDLKIKIARLQAQLDQTEQIVGGTHSTIKGLDNDLNSQAIDLEAQLETQKKGINHSDAEASIDIQAQANGALEGEQLKTAEEKPTTLPFAATAVTPIATEAAPETVSQDAFNRLIAEFGELTNVMGSIASLIVRDHVRALGESMEEFPQTRVTKLLESLSKEISDDELKADFCERFAKM